jgi:hypothetical protein
MNPKIAGIIRHTLTFAAGILVATGKATPDQVNQIGGLVQEGAGAVLALGGALWSIFAPEKQGS